MRYSIQHKILISFSLIIFIGLSSLLFVTYKTTEQNTLQIINNDMIDARKNLDLYLKQYFLINNMEIDKPHLESEAGNISRGLSTQMGSDVNIYDATGNSIINSFKNPANVNNAFQKALKGETAYTISHIDNKTTAVLSYPIECSGNVIGILSYNKNYTEQYSYNKRFNNILNLFATAIFILIFITSIIISKQITKPVRELIKSSEQISAGDFDVDIHVDSHDEIGELGDRFKIMAKKIKEQINIIEEDRDALKDAQAQSKSFFDNVTHELKTPLTTILGYAQVLKENGFSDKEFFDKGTSYIINESKRLNNMVVEILELCRISSSDIIYHYNKVDLSDIVTKTCDEMRIKAKKYKIDIAANIEDSLFLTGDAGKLKEVLINLIDNSIKYANVNSIIRVKAYKYEDIIYLKVKDEGEGIPDEHINNLFKPFYRVSKKVSREKGSAGLGLAIVKEIVEKHKGVINIKSNIHQGTEIEIQFGGK